jgi:hypothetical protein
MWCIRLRFKPRVNAKWKMKGSLRPLTHEGFYATEKEAKSKVFDHRMILEANERRGGYWYAPMSMSSGGAVDVRRVRWLPMNGSEPTQSNSASIQPVVATWTKRRSERWLKLLPRTRITLSGQRGRRGSLESSEGGAKGLFVSASQRIGGRRRR